MKQCPFQWIGQRLNRPGIDLGKKFLTRPNTTTILTQRPRIDLKKKSYLDLSLIHI